MEKYLRGEIDEKRKPLEDYGMTDTVGALSFYDSTGARGYDLTKPYSEKTAELIDQEVKNLVSMIHDRTMKILLDHKEGFIRP